MEKFLFAFIQYEVASSGVDIVGSEHKQDPMCPRPTNSSLDVEDLLVFLTRERCK